MTLGTPGSAHSGGDQGSLPPLSRGRIKAGLDREGWTTSIDAEGDIGGGWEFGSFYFFAHVG